jgi:hypothetical protein
MRAAQRCVHADGWIHTDQLAFFVGKSTSLQPPVTRAVGEALVVITLL